MSDTSAVHNKLDSLRHWIRDHDDRWSFLVPYIFLAVTLPIVLGLFWLLVIVAVHVALEWARQKELTDDPKELWLRVLWEVKLDFALIIFSFALTVYMDVVLGILGLGGAARAGLQAGSRFAAWQNAARAILLSVDDVAQVARGLSAGKKSGDPEEMAEATEPFEGETHVTAPLPMPWEGFPKSWDWLDFAAMIIGFGFTLLLLLTPVLTEHSYLQMFQMILADLHPFAELYGDD